MKIQNGIISLALFLTGIFSAGAQGTVFSYEGRLSDGGQPANGTNYGMVFYLYDAPTNGAVLGNFGIVSVTVSNGLFSTPLDFGNQFDGTPRWLEITVQKNGGAFSTLVPRQRILAVPYAIMANSASNLLGTLPAAQVSGSLPVAQISGTVPLAQLPAGVVTNFENNVDLGGFFNGQYFGNGSGLTNLSPQGLVSGGVGAQLYFTNGYNSFNGFFEGQYFGNGSGLTNLSPQSLVNGGVGAQLYFTNGYNSFNGFFDGQYFGNGSGLTNLSPQGLVSGGVGAQLYFTNGYNSFNGFFDGQYFGNGSGLTNVPVDGVQGGLTINVAVLAPGGGTNVLCFTNGILRAVK
ncbi:MAG TPA: hypothetical protein VK815_03555 [Candidatus Acidoferrales bacterium]|nr:hypothetical protein [Candidatus Acidoferrales bacterium]